MCAVFVLWGVNMKTFAAIVATAVMLLFCLRWFPAVHAVAWTVPEGYGATALTAEQTLALYGTALDAVYFDGVENHNITFQYFNTTSNLYDYYCQTQNISPVPGVKLQFVSNRYGFMSTMGDNYGQLQQNTFVNHNFLIYRCQIGSLNSTFDQPWSYQVYLENSVDISGISAFYSSLFWSNYAGIGNVADYVYPISSSGIYDNPFIPRSSLDLFIDNSALSDRFTPIMNGNAGRIFVFGSCMAPYDYHYPEGVGDVTRFDYNYWFNGITYDYTVPDVTNGDTFSWDKTVLYCQNMNGAMQYSEGWYDEFGVAADSTYSFSDPYIYLLVQCPVLYGEFILPDNTGTGSGSDTGTGSGSGSGSGGCSCDVDVNVTVDVDLSPVLTNQADQIDQLNQIIVQLQDIFDFMIDNGQINPDLTPVASITTNTTVKNRIDQALQNADFPDSEDFDTDTLDGLSLLIGQMRETIPAPLLFVYGFGLIGGLTSFIIFRRK